MPSVIIDGFHLPWRTCKMATTTTNYHGVSGGREHQCLKIEDRVSRFKPVTKERKLYLTGGTPQRCLVTARHQETNTAHARTADKT